jgi:hypothetical protein
VVVVAVMVGLRGRMGLMGLGGMMIPRGMMTGRVVPPGSIVRLLPLLLLLRALGVLTLIGRAGVMMGMEIGQMGGLLALLARLVLLGRAVLMPRAEAVMAGVLREMVIALVSVPVPVCKMATGLRLAPDLEGMLAEAIARVRARARWKMVVLSGLRLLRLGQG